MDYQTLRDEAEQIRREFVAGHISFEEAKKLLKPFKAAFDVMAAEKAAKYHVKPQKLNISMYLKMTGLPRENLTVQHVPGVINIGYDMKMKEQAVKEYLKNHLDVKNVIVFYPDGWPTLELDAEKIPFSEVIMYRTFYPLIEKLKTANSYLLVFDECMRLKKRNDLSYNCIHHYCNQVDHKLVFEYLPFIDEPDDYMILMDFIDAARYRGKHFTEDLFDEVPVSVVEKTFSLVSVMSDPPGDAAKYEEKKKELFNNLGNKNPDTVPNALQLFAGQYKVIMPNGKYIARNKRYKASNVSVMKDDIQGDGWTFVDLPLRQKIFNDILVRSGMHDMKFLHSGLPIDDYFFNRYSEWIKEVQKFNAQASVHERKRIGSG